MDFDYAALDRRLIALENNRGTSLRFCTVTEVDPAKGTARVQLPDGKDMVSHPLRVLQSRVLKDQRQIMPDVGESVAVLFAGQGFEQGAVLGGWYSPETPSPNQPPAHDYMRYEDGTEQWYDRKAHEYNLNVNPGGVIRLRIGASLIEMTASRILIQSSLVTINP